MSRHDDWPDDLSPRGGLLTGIAAVLIGVVLVLLVMFAPAIASALIRAGVL